MNKVLSSLEDGLPPLFSQAYSRLIKQIEKEQGNASLTDFLWTKLLYLKKESEHKRQLFKKFEEKNSGTDTTAEKQNIILEFSKELGASPQDLAEDKKAFSRWFDFEAIADKCRHQISSSERDLCFIIDRLTFMLVNESLEAQGDFINFLKDLICSYNGNQRVKIAALDSILKLRPSKISIDEKVFYHLASSKEEDAWIQCKAIEILRQLNQSLFRQLAASRLKVGEPDPDLFVRQHIVTLLEEEDFSLTPTLYSNIISDPSDLVRQTLCEKMPTLPLKIIKKLLEDSSPQVRAMAILKIVSDRSFEERSTYLKSKIENESDGFVLRVCLKCVIDGFKELTPPQEITWLQNFEPILDYLASSADLLSIRRRAAQARELLWCKKNASRYQVLQDISSFLKTIRLGEEIRLSPRLYQNITEHELGRIISIVTQADFECDLIKTSRGYKIYRGLRLRFRWWRFFYEFFHPKTDKRQAVSHTVGRFFKGTIQIPSAILSEFSNTQVPGEPLYIPEEEGYRPYLPLLDHVLSSLQQGRLMRLYTSEGVTSILPPLTLWNRLKAKIVLTFQFSSIANLRNWTIHRPWPSNSYIKYLQNLGFKIDFCHHEEQLKEDNTITRFFPAASFFASWDTIESYILSPYHINTSHLLFFCGSVFIYFLWQHISAYQAIKHARKSIPLIIGGWGTRGKSSTEHLKSALMSSIGLSLFSKTTGCEPMISIAGPFQKIKGIPLYRPENKATIWEQLQMTVLAEKYGSDVMLWECMGLKGSYVKIMQQQWMQDTISTITNAFPDHEDIQGPAGYNIAQTMTNFIQPGSLLITGEEQMLPYFVEDAFIKYTQLRAVGWLEEGLLTKDAMSRFSYIEHPQNVALVLSMATDFGMPKVVALKEIADNTVPDIGALKVYAPAALNSRSLQFINGMSANEKFSCLKSWNLVGLNQPIAAGEWVTTFINNRADRIGRSQTFANLIVNDISADKHFLVGSNIQEFMQFVIKEWKKLLENTSSDLLHGIAKKLRMCTTKEDLKARLEAMGCKNYQGDLFNLVSLEHYLKSKDYAYTTALLSIHKQNVKTVQQYDFLIHNNEEDNKIFKKILTEWFLSKFVLQFNDGLTGDELAAWIVENTPPFYVNKIMGIQNIKGPGLELVHCWEAWEECYQAGELLFNPLDKKRAQGFRNFLAIPEFGLLSKEYLESLLSNPELLKKNKNELENLKTYIQSLINNNKKIKNKKYPFLIDYIVRFFDVNRSFKRLKTAHQIYQDLSCHRVSFSRALKELKKLNIIQKSF